MEELKFWVQVKAIALDEMPSSPAPDNVYLICLDRNTGQEIHMGMHLTDALYLLTQLLRMSKAKGFDDLWREL